jgi:2-aminoadipate transaminase
MLEMIKRYLPDKVKTTQPNGGMFIWLTLPEGLRSDELIHRTMERGVIFVPGNSFFTNGQGNQNVRMNFTNADFEAIEKGVKIMGEEMVKMLQRAVV